MEQNIINLNNIIYSDINYILLEIIKDLQLLMNSSKDNLITQVIGNIINKINYLFNENKKNMELIENDIISSIYDKINKKLEELKINEKNIQELKRDDGKYVGEIVNGLSEGRGICYFINGDRYEGEWKNNKKEKRK